MTSPSCMARMASLTSCRWHGARHHRADVELALLDEADEARELAPHLGRAVHAAEDPLLVEHRHRRDADLGVEPGHRRPSPRCRRGARCRRPGGSCPRCRSPRTRSRRRGRRSARAPPRPGRRRTGRSHRWRRASSAASRFNATGSMAMMRAAPAMRAPWITAWPTPPQPITATIEPGSTRRC